MITAQLDLPLDVTPRQRHLLDAARQWRDFASTASPEGLARVSIATAESLERQAQDGIARCVCCRKPF